MNDKQSTNLSGLRVLAMSADEADLSKLIAGLEQAKVEQATPVTSVAELKLVFDKGETDAVLISISSATNTDILAEIQQITGACSCPTGLFLDSKVDVNLGEIIDAGICTVVVDGLAPKRIPRLLETTVYRYNKMRGLQIQLEEALSALEERKLIDRAKGVLIEQRSISEPEAYKLLRQAAMNKNCKISDIAQTIIIASEV